MFVPDLVELAIDLKLTKAQATATVDWLELGPDGMQHYFPDMSRKEAIRWLTGQFSFAHEHDCLNDRRMQIALVGVGAQGQATFGFFNGGHEDNVYTHTFLGGKYYFAKGNVRDLVGGHLPLKMSTVKPRDIFNATKSSVAAKKPVAKAVVVNSVRINKTTGEKTSERTRLD